MDHRPQRLSMRTKGQGSSIHMFRVDIERQHDSKRAPCTENALYFQASTVAFNDLARDIKTEPQTCPFAILWFHTRYAIELLKDVRQGFRRNTNSHVAYGKQGFIARLLQANRDGRTFGRIFACIGEQIEHHLTETRLIYFGFDRLIRKFAGQFGTCSSEPSTQAPVHVVQGRYVVR